MIKNLEKSLLQFLNKYSAPHPLLVGLSGGPDSMALFHLLLEVKYPFMAAHIDHGWRAESALEAGALESLCKQHQIPFFMHRLEKMEVERNLEDICRNKRLDFFRECVQKQGLKGVMLAHHRDDQAETILKRVFEGASLQKLKGLSEISDIQNLWVFRPFLNIPKSDLLKWLEEKGISYFTDSTNEDSRFLRSRLRKTLFPFLKEEFGKEVSKSLCRIGKNAEELALFIEDFLIPYRKRKEEKEGRICLDFNRESPKFLFLWKAVIRDFFSSLEMTFSDSVLETLIFHLQENSQNITVRIGKKEVFIHKKLLSVSQFNNFK